MNKNYSVSDEVPSLEDYLRLRVLSGLSPKSREGAEIGLTNTIVGVVVRAGDQVVGMGRVIGDGGLFFQVTDIAVHPQHQQLGLGHAIMKNLMERLSAIAPEGAYVSLIADGQANRLYAKFGFLPTAPASIGMAQVLRRG